MVDNRDKSVSDVGHDHHPVPGAAGPIGRAVRDHVDAVDVVYGFYVDDDYAEPLGDDTAC